MFRGQMCFKDELKRWKENSKYWWQHLLSATSEDESFAYVHAVYEEIIGQDKPEASFFLCGWKNMIDDAKEKITALGYDRKAIHQEIYG